MVMNWINDDIADRFSAPCGMVQGFGGFPSGFKEIIPAKSLFHTDARAV